MHTGFLWLFNSHITFFFLPVAIAVSRVLKKGRDCSRFHGRIKPARRIDSTNKCTLRFHSSNSFIQRAVCFSVIFWFICSRCKSSGTGRVAAVLCKTGWGRKNSRTDHHGAICEGRREYPESRPKSATASRNMTVHRA